MKMIKFKIQNLKFCVLICSLAFYILSFTFFCFAQEVTNMKKVVMVIAHEGFRDEEFLQPKEILEKGGIEVKVASSSMADAEGMLGARVKPDILISDININEFDGIIFVGGRGASEYWDDSIAQKLAKDADSSGKIVAAICIAPVTLANAGILEGKKATVWATEAQQLRNKGAQYTGKKIEKDGNIITANGPIAADEFGQAILEALK